MASRRSKVIFLSGPYSEFNDDSDRKHTVGENIDIARKYAIVLWEMGFTVYCPHLNTAHFEKDCECEYGDYIDGNLEILSRCDAIFMLPFWSHSRGAQIELNHTDRRGMRIFHNLSEIEEWAEEIDNA